MASTEVLSVRIEKSTRDRLAKLASAMKRSQSFLAAEAIEEFVSVQEWQIAGIQDAIDTLDRSEGIPHADMKAWAQSLPATDRQDSSE